MSVSRGNMDDEVYRTSITANLSDTDVPGTLETDVVADEDRYLVGWSPLGSNLPYDSSHEIAVTAWMSRVQVDNPSEDSTSVNDKSPELFNAGVFVQNDATNGVGYAGVMNADTVMLPQEDYIEWNEDVPITLTYQQFQTAVGEPVETILYWKER